VNLTEQADPVAIGLAAPCWWIDRNDPWEISHHATRLAAEETHADQVREDHGWPLSVAGAFAIVPGVARREVRRCYEVTCPECGAEQHIQDHTGECVDECGYEFVIDQIALNDPEQTRLFEVLPTQDIAGQPANIVITFADKRPELGA